jgi:glycosyltransferase involved in cell wall biosynthesis
MISVVIATQDHERVLGQALAALVPAAADGLVRQVIVADGGSTDATLEIADDAGADILNLRGPAAARIAAACAKARGDWLLILDPSVIPPPGWMAVAREHMAGQEGRAAWFAPGRGGLLGGPPPAHGLLISRRLLDEVGGYQADLGRRLGRRLRRLRPTKGGL